jgi:hypothetical protein
LDATLCRKLASIRFTPYWLYLASLRGGITSDDWQKHLEQITDAATSAYTFDKLPLDIKNLIERCDRSTQIALRLFGDMSPELLSSEQLEQVSREIFKDEPLEEVEE